MSKTNVIKIIPQYFYTKICTRNELTSYDKTSRFILEDVDDLSINGLQTHTLISALKNHIKYGFFNNEQLKSRHLGRWKVNVDIFSSCKSYSYDHSLF